MMSDITFEQVKHLIEQLEPDEVERLREWLNTPPAEEHPTAVKQPTWGEQLVALVRNYPLDEADQMAIDDPESWVREHRAKPEY